MSGIKARKIESSHSARVVFDYLFAKLSVFKDGSSSIHFENDRTKEDLKIDSVADAGYLGGGFQASFRALAYDMQDELIQLIANAEHAALHLWIDYARRTSHLALKHSDARHRRMLYKSLEVNTQGQISEHILEEGFTTSIQLIANGIQPTPHRTDELESAATFLGLNSKHAIPSALAFVAFFRAQMRAKITQREMLNSETV